MLTLENITDVILKKDHWQVFDLHMTPLGFEKLGNCLASLNQTSPQVYVHVCDEGGLENKVLRIGKAESGVYTRWIKAIDGHRYTFLWAVGHCEKYGPERAKKYLAYLLFFAGLLEVRTKLYVLTCQDGDRGKGAARASEKALISYYPPLWERYRRLISATRLSQDILESIKKPGGARLVLAEQRKGKNHPIPDLCKMCFDSDGTGYFPSIV